MNNLSRRSFMGLLGAGAMSAAAGWKQEGADPLFRIRTITAGVELAGAMDLRSLSAARDFLSLVKPMFADSFEVQTTRVATQPLPRYLPFWMSIEGLEAARKLDEFVSDAGVVMSVGPVLLEDGDAPGFASWAADFLQATTSTSFSSFVASPNHGIHPRSIKAAAEAISAIAHASPGGKATSATVRLLFVLLARPFSRRRITRGRIRSASASNHPACCWQPLKGRLPGRRLSGRCALD